MPEPVQMAVTTPPPDWATFAADVRCPLCDYNLRGLSDPRCPECGYRFDWADVTAPPPSVPFLFECQPRRNAWSFFATQLRGWRPGRFWQDVRPELRIRPVRLLAYWLLSATLFLAVASTGLVTSGFDFFRMARIGSASRWTAKQFLRVLFAYRHGFGSDLAAAVGFLCWPWLTFAVLQVFAMSMRRARVRRWHVLRCVLYSCDFGLAAALAFPLMLWFRPFRFDLDTAATAAVTAGLPMVIYAGYRLGTAYHLYLRFHRPFLTAAASQAIAVLIAWKVAYWVSGY